MPTQADQLRNIRTFKQLTEYLRDELNWPVEDYGFEQLTFEYEPAEIGLKDADAAKVKTIYQLRPLYQGQPWGIFFVEFERKKLPVVVLRRILSQLVLKQRASANKANRPAWLAEDLLFISAFGELEANTREIAFAHFQQETGDLPTLRVLGWDGADTPLKLEYVAATLKAQLCWPKNEKDAAAWRAQWRAPFKQRVGHVIRTANALAEALAGLARSIRDACQTILAAESERGALRKLYKAFQTALIHDATESDFADTYAQTITYGLLTAALSRTDMSGGRYDTALTATDVTDMVPVTNPFLREMLQTFLHVGGRRNGINFDELGIQDVVELLRGDETDLPAVVRDFGNRAPGEDPVIHFYEHFLSAYNKKLKVQRGVFYTPQPVVSYIVRSVHELLQSEFGLPDGLASTTTWGELSRQNPEIKIPAGTAPTAPFVTILDPATGTATFLVEVIDVIHKHLQAQWQKGGVHAVPLISNQAQYSGQQSPISSFADYWNAYVPQHLLPRLFGYELMMAPYAIAHMKVPLKLRETGFNAWGKLTDADRVRIYLTNSLEPPTEDKQMLLLGILPALAHESEAVNRVKREQTFLIVIGNPPYSRSSSNKGKYIEGLVKSYKSAVRNEKNIQPLSDDYIKFFRISQYWLTQTGVGIHGMITNNSFLSGRIHHGMRESLRDTFAMRDIVNLHGSGNVKFLGRKGVGDENVFDILQGVTISILVRGSKRQRTSYTELIGSRQVKYELLTSQKTPAPSLLDPQPPYFLWIPRNRNNDSEYQTYVSLNDIFHFYNVSGKPGDDSLLVSFTHDDVLPKLQSYMNAFKGSDEAELTEAGRNMVLRPKKKQFDKTLIEPYAYRPFDTRYTYYDPTIWTRAVKPLKVSVDGSPILLTTKLVKDAAFAHVFVTRVFPDVIFLSNTSSVNSYSFPSKVDENVSNSLFGNGAQLAENINTTPFNHQLKSVVKTAEVFAYIYAILHSLNYRLRYYEWLQYDFPRIPIPSNLELYRLLVALGNTLVALHLMESPRLKKHITRYTGQRNPTVEKATYEKDAVWVDKAQTVGFRGVPQDVWEFHIGGYQVCEKWLKDRKGRELNAEDIAHYQRVVVALHETIRLMGEIDEVIDQHGGWPIK